MTLVDLDKLEALERAATPGPWDKVDSMGEVHIYCCSNSDGHIHSGDWVASAADGDEAALILAARNELPAMIAELRDTRPASKQRDNLVMLLKRLCYATGLCDDKRVQDIRAKALDFIEREGLLGSVMRCRNPGGVKR